MTGKSKQQADNAGTFTEETLNERGNPHATFADLQNSPWVAHLNRTWQRSFSLNIFMMNAQELVQIIQQVHDINEGLRLLSHDNNEAGNQIHREVSRRIHNFAVSALTLVEHTRNFMRKHYKETTVFKRYQEKIRTEFASDPVSQFVQQLRNYMVHRGLPNSQMYLHIDQDPSSGQGATFVTGVRLDAKMLLEWDGWNSAARQYLESTDEFVDIQHFTTEYTRRVEELHAWLQVEFDQHHSDDQIKFQELLSRSKGFQETPSNLAQVSLMESPPEDNAEHQLDHDASLLLGKIRKLELINVSEDEFQTQRPIAASLSEKDIIGTPLFWSYDVHGNYVFKFIESEDGAYGLDKVDYNEIQTLTETVLKFSWAEKNLSRKFIEEAIIIWLQESFQQKQPQPFSPYLQNKAEKISKSLSLWAPITNFETEVAFQFGPVEIRPITAEMLDRLEAQFIQSTPESAEQVIQLLNDIRGRMQGFGAVVIEKTCEPKRLMEEGYETAKVAVGLLRFLSSAAANPPATTGVELLGKDSVPVYHLITLGEQYFNYSMGKETPGDPGMRVSKKAVANLEAVIAALGALIQPEELSQFAFIVRASLLLFGNGLTQPNVLDRLSYSVSAMERLLLRHSAEARELNVSKRMSILLSQNEITQDNDVALSARESYRILARRDLSPLAPHQNEAAIYFCLNSYRILHLALANVDRFNSVQEFIGAIEHSANR